MNNGPLIKFNGYSVRVDSSCPTAVSSLDEPVCGRTSVVLYPFCACVIRADTQAEW